MKNFLVLVGSPVKSIQGEGVEGLMVKPERALTHGMATPISQERLEFVAKTPMVLAMSGSYDRKYQPLNLWNNKKKL